MKCAFIIMGPYDPQRDRAAIANGAAWIVGVPGVEEACATAQALYAEGIECVELCGAFEAEGAKRVIEATGGKLAVGYTVHLPQQDALFDRLFGRR